MSTVHDARPHGLAALPSVMRLIELALDEDLGRGDVTTQATVRAGAMRASTAEMVARAPLTVFGLDIAAAVFHRVDPSIAITRRATDGDRVGKGAVLLTVHGSSASLLEAERTALNFVQRLSGVATMSTRFAEAVAGTAARVVDTRKTTPGFRVLEKAAVLAGGCGNHRFDLGSGVLIKDNHVIACGGVTAAVERARTHAPHPLRIEVEVDSIAQLREALAAKAEIVLLDNMTPEEVTEAAAIAHAAGARVEVSGGITLATVRAYALAGADLISAGALTHSAPSVDIALDFAEAIA